MCASFYENTIFNFYVVYNLLHHPCITNRKSVECRHRIGHSKVFFRAGVLGYLEEVRDDIVIKLTRWLQGACWGHLRRRDFAKRKMQRELMTVVQRNFRKFLTLRHWPWFMLIQKTKPLIGMVNIEEEIRDAIQRRCDRLLLFVLHRYPALSPIP